MSKTTNMNCPHCDFPRLVLDKKKVSVPVFGDSETKNNKSCFQDGDYIVGLCHALEKKELEKHYTNTEEPPFDGRLGIGQCPKCKGFYYGIILNLSPPNIQINENFADIYFRYSQPMPKNTKKMTFPVQKVIKQVFVLQEDKNEDDKIQKIDKRMRGAGIHDWFFEKYLASIGYVHTHTFGLFALNQNEAEEMEGNCGIALSEFTDISEEAKEFLVYRWAYLKELIKQDNERLTAATFDLLPTV